MTTKELNVIVKETLGGDYKGEILQKNNEDFVQIIVKEKIEGICFVCNYRLSSKNVFGVYSVSSMFFANQTSVKRYLKFLNKLETEEE